MTGVADALLDRSPMVALTGQADLERMHKESHQYIDVVDMLRPVTKFNTRLNSARVIPEVVRKAFKVAQAQKPGPTHIELPEDVMAAQVDAEPLPVRDAPAAGRSRAPTSCAPRSRSSATPSGRSCWPATASPAPAPPPRCARSPTRPASASPRRSWARAMLDYEDPRALGTVGLQSRDYALAGFEDADVVITVGYDLVEHAPANWNPKRDKRIVCIDTVAPEVDEHFMTEVDLVGDLAHILDVAGRELGTTAVHDRSDSRLNEIVLGRFEAAKDDDAFPMQPPRALWEIRQALGRRDILISDVGLHKLWIARMFPAHEPETVFIANGLAGMGIALPTGDRRQARAPGPQRRHGQRRRRLPDERAGARDRGAAAHARSST